jgi:hypothetical protein
MGQFRRVQMSSPLANRARWEGFREHAPAAAPAGFLRFRPQPLGKVVRILRHPYPFDAFLHLGRQLGLRHRQALPAATLCGSCRTRVSFHQGLTIGDPSTASASRPASMIRTFPTSMIFPPARTFSYGRVASPWLTRSRNIPREAEGDQYRFGGTERNAGEQF